jgi:AcrR family transcriptional regulator
MVNHGVSQNGGWMPKQYQLKKRAERQEETRRRIIRAAIELHAAGDASISSLARRAGVGRVTVYRHFPDEGSLAIACTAAYFEEHPFPDAAPLLEVRDPEARLRAGLEELYQYYADNEPMLTAAERDVVEHPVLIEALAPHMAPLERMRDVLAAGWPVATSNQTVIASAIGHALAFTTWRSLARDQGLSRTQSVELMTTMLVGGRAYAASQLPAVEQPTKASRPARSDA